ncbi:sigma-54-dependent Fis family transcriptional regulator [Shewanella sp. 202IG2-18]|uniref:sigma-54-dependent transcriptional regulator n=1 Tax=Parashewanella hymeniacidonis TaxID=2807618 RepID=UPI00195FD12D|nr:sigma-54 dependent transcriptional regulator [Parashewanella hymeniacidonis]MBM7072553.1 sigma-54-dependent Fis family transcriptional regulator [Parashewanella hymeniacidonis]
MTIKTVLIVDDDQDVRFALTLLLTHQGYQVYEADSPTACKLLLKEIAPDLILLDLNFTQDTTSGREGLSLLKTLVPQKLKVILMTAWACVDLVVEGLQAGAVDFVEKPWDKTSLLQKIKRQRSSVETYEQYQEPWVAESEAMKQLERLIQQLAITDANILITGENGTGKSLLAKHIHQSSQRTEKSFESLNMAAIPETLFESELFGHKKGAFTDAKFDRKGAFQRAEKGTLFLDEIGTLPFHLQPKLLQVLENGSFTTLGADETVKADVRIIAATNADLDDAVEQGRFREDLLYRLNTFTIEIPPLRERKQDITPLAMTALHQLATKYQKPVPELSDSAIKKLVNHVWLGNVRELNHVMERVLLLSDGSEVLAEHIPLSSFKKRSIKSELIPELSLAELEMKRIVYVMEKAEGQVSIAAKELGISRNALYRRLEKYQLAEEYE